MCGLGKVEDAESGDREGANAAFPRLLLRAARGRLRDEKTRRILYGLRSCLNSRSPDVEGKREPRDRPRGERKITAGAGFHITRVCRDTTYSLKSPNRSSVLQQLHRHPLHKRMEISEVYGSVAQLVVRQIPALKVACSSHAWVIFFD